MTRRQVNSEFGMRVSEGLRRSAADRKCPECGRHGALVEAEAKWVRDDIIRVSVSSAGGRGTATGGSAPTSRSPSVPCFLTSGRAADGSRRDGRQPA